MILESLNFIFTQHLIIALGLEVERLNLVLFSSGHVSWTSLVVVGSVFKDLKLNIFVYLKYFL